MIWRYKMSIDINKDYFRMSFRFDKKTPEEFGLTHLNKTSNRYIDVSDNSYWIQRKLYDFGWGNENGFMRHQNLSFDELWCLLVESKLEANRYGAAYVILNEYPEELLSYLDSLFDNPNNNISDSMKEAFEILGLEEVRNRCETTGKSYEEVNREYEKWKYVSKRVKEILSIK